MAYCVACLIAHRLEPARAHVYAATAVALALAGYWSWFDHSIHTENRYYLRTVVLVMTPGFGMMAAAYAFNPDGRLKPRIALVPQLMNALSSGTMRRGVLGALMLLLLVHAVETAKFASAWDSYKTAVRSLAIGTASDPALGNARFVSSDRIGASLNRLSWFSTTHFLSVLVAPNLVPARLVIEPSANYFWLACKTAKPAPH